MEILGLLIIVAMSVLAIRLGVSPLQLLDSLTLPPLLMGLAALSLLSWLLDE